MCNLAWLVQFLWLHLWTFNSIKVLWVHRTIVWYHRILLNYFLLQNYQVWITIEDFHQNCSIFTTTDTAGGFEVLILCLRVIVQWATSLCNTMRIGSTLLYVVIVWRFIQKNVKISMFKQLVMAEHDLYDMSMLLWHVRVHCFYHLSTWFRTSF